MFAEFQVGQVWQWRARSGRTVHGAVIDRPFQWAGNWWVAMQIDNHRDPKLLRAAKLRDTGQLVLEPKVRNTATPAPA